jgi:transcription initiation factor TFIID subunit TAF12
MDGWQIMPAAPSTSDRIIPGALTPCQTPTKQQAMPAETQSQAKHRYSDSSFIPFLSGTDLPSQRLLQFTFRL